MMAATPSVASEVDTALQLASEILPAIVGPLATAYPVFGIFAKLLPLLPTLVQAVDTVGQVMEGTPGTISPEAVAAVQDHLTPGAPNAPALAGAAQ